MIALAPCSEVAGKNDWIDGTVVRVGVSGIPETTVVERVEGWLRVEWRRGRRQMGSICDAMSRPE